MGTEEKLCELIKLCDSYGYFCMNADSKCPLYNGKHDCFMIKGITDVDTVENAYIQMSKKKLEGYDKPTQDECMQNYMMAWCSYHYKVAGPCSCPFATRDNGCIINVFTAPAPVIEAAVKICTNYLECGGK